MSLFYVEQSLAPDEKLIHIGRFHWFYDLMALSNIFWGLFFAVSVLLAAIQIEPYLPAQLTVMTTPLESGDSWLTQFQKLHAGFKLLALLLVMLGVLKFVQMLVIKITTEVAVTSNRIIYKRGLVARYVGEININRVEGVSVSQSFWGRIFNFGQLLVRGMGVGEMVLPTISDPLTFRRAIEKARIIDEQEEVERRVSVERVIERSHSGV